MLNIIFGGLARSISEQILEQGLCVSDSPSEHCDKCKHWQKQLDAVTLLDCYSILSETAVSAARKKIGNDIRKNVYRRTQK